MKQEHLLLKVVKLILIIKSVNLMSFKLFFLKKVNQKNVVLHLICLQKLILHIFRFSTLFLTNILKHFFFLK